MFLSDGVIAEMEPTELARVLTEKGKILARDVTLVAGDALCEFDPQPYKVYVCGHGAFSYPAADIRDPEGLKASLVEANTSIEDEYYCPYL